MPPVPYTLPGGGLATFKRRDNDTGVTTRDYHITISRFDADINKINVATVVNNTLCPIPGFLTEWIIIKAFTRDSKATKKTHFYKKDFLFTKENCSQN